MKNFRIALALSLVFALFVPSVLAQEYNSVNDLENSNINNAENVSENSSEDNDDMQAQIVFSESTDQSLDKDTPPIVWFVHGVKFIPTNYKGERRILRIIYPDAEGADSNGVTLKKWDSPWMISKRRWKRAVQVADDYSQDLADEIIALPKEKQKRLILAGHSLGGHIVVRTAAILHKNNIKIRKIILAGAAIDNDDKDIASTWVVSNETVVNLINTQDIALAFYCWIGEKQAALGTGYKGEYPKGEYRGKFHEIPVHKSLSHDKYFKVYKMLSDNFYDEIVAPQVRPNWNWKTMNKRMWWDIVDECHGWELQRNLATSRYRIVDDNNVRRAWGHLADAKEVIEVFEIIKGRLIEKKGKSPRPDKWWLLINPVQDEFTIYTKKNADSKKWKTLEEYKGWKFQITNKSIKKEPPKIDDQEVEKYRLKKEAFNKAKSEYYTKIYEYKFFKKKWSKILDKAYYAKLDDGFNEQLKKELEEEFGKEDELDKDIEEELSDDNDEEMDSEQKKEMIKDLKKELDEELNSEVDKELTKEYWEKYSDRIEQLKNGMDKKQVKELRKQSDEEYDKDVDELKKDINYRKNRLNDQRKNGEITKKEYKDRSKKLKDERKDKKNRLEKEHDEKEKQLKNQSFKNQYKELYNELKEDYKTQKKQLKNEVKGLKDKYKEAEKEYKKVKKYDETDCRILDPENRRRVKGNKTNLEESFKDVKKQIDNLFKRYNN